VTEVPGSTFEPLNATSPGAPGMTDQPPGDKATIRSVRLDSLRRSLFPTPSSGPRHKFVPVIAPLAVLVGVPLAALRIPARMWNSLWAEDGHIFLQSALDEPFWKPFVTTYAGYLHTFPRLISALAGALPLEWAACLYSFSAAALVVWVAWTAWSASAGLLRSPWLRGALAVAVVAAPAGGMEAAVNVANSHFFLMFGAFWALLGRPRSRVGLVSGHLLVLLATLSDPVTLAVLPVALVRFVLLPEWRDRALSVTFAMGMAVQLAAVAGAERATGGALPELPDLVFGYDLRVVATHFLGITATRHLIAGGAVTVALVATGFLVLLTAGLLVAQQNKLAAIAAAVASVAFFTIASAFSLGGAYPPGGDSRFDLGVSNRYSIVPGLLLLSAWVMVAQGVVTRVKATIRPAVVLLALAPVVAFTISDFRHDTSDIRGGPVGWAGAVAEFERFCSTHPHEAAQAIETQPGGAWVVRVNCRDVD
jgi:hypothetical protein